MIGDYRKIIATFPSERIKVSIRDTALQEYSTTGTSQKWCMGRVPHVLVNQYYRTYFSFIYSVGCRENDKVCFLQMSVVQVKPTSELDTLRALYKHCKSGGKPFL